MNRQNRHMARRCRGFTLVELLVILAIIALMAGIAIPAFLSRDYFSNTNLRVSARDVYALLEAARVYASTHNVPTAVVYGLETVTDSESGQPVTVIDSMAVARLAKSPDEQERLKALSNVNLDEAFIPLAGDDGRFAKLRRNTAVLPAYGKTINATYGQKLGLESVSLYDMGADPPERIDARVGYDTADEKAFPAIVFQPSGIIQSDSTRERYVFRIGPMPDSNIGDRFLLNSEGDIVLDAQGNPDERYITVQLFRSTGRVLVSDEANS